MKSIFDPGASDHFRERMRRLRPDSPAQWGRMNAEQMLCHLIDALHVPLGEVPVKEVPGHPLRFFPLRWLLVYALPWPKGKIPTLPEFQKTRSVNFPEEQATFSAALDRFVARAQSAEPYGVHPGFGRLSSREWGRLVFKHMDHHFRQFGI
jgi:hypothetical protein